MIWPAPRFLPLLLLPALGLLACGHSEEEWQAELDKYNHLATEHQSTQSKLDKTTKDLEAAAKKVGDLERQLQASGLELQNTSKKLSSVNATLEERERALVEYQARAKQLELIKARFETLKRKLDELTKLGLAVSIRKNRMVISLPGDVLFDSGRETLKKDGEQILLKVAEVIRNDAGLSSRNFQVAGHTDNAPLTGGRYKDNWGLSVMRAREVLTFLIAPTTAKEPGGGLSPTKWSAAGFGDTDPVKTNDTPEGKQANRRCELVVVPSVEEMLDLKSLTQ